MIVRYSRYGSSGAIAVGVRSKADPASTGDHIFFFAPNAVAPATPWTISIATSRSFFAAAASRPKAVAAGVMASRNGSPIATPSPFKTARLGTCFLVRNIPVLLSRTRDGLKAVPYDWRTRDGLKAVPYEWRTRNSLKAVPYQCGGRDGVNAVRSDDPRASRRVGRLARARLERRAVDDPDHEGREAKIRRRRLPDNRPHRRHVVVLDPASERIGHQVFGEGLQDDVLMRQERRAQPRWTVDLRPVVHHAGGVDRHVVVLDPPPAGDVD